MRRISEEVLSSYKRGKPEAHQKMLDRKKLNHEKNKNI